MALIKFIVEVEIDDEALAEHDGNATAPPNDPRDWYGGDLVAAFDQCLAEVVHDQLEIVP